MFSDVDQTDCDDDTHESESAYESDDSNKTTSRGTAATAAATVDDHFKLESYRYFHVSMHTSVMVCTGSWISNHFE